MSCQICYGEINEENLHRLPCNDIMCENCFKEWNEKSNKCPFCRFEFRENIIPNTNLNVNRG